MISPGGVLQGRYRILDQLGEGGMGRVYLAEGLQLQRQWAIKELLASSPDDPDHEACLKAFQAEAHLLADLHHPNLPRVVDYFEEGDRHYLVMDYIQGTDLRRLLEQGQQFALETVVGWGQEIARVLEYLHSQDPPIVVRDLKPANLILTESGSLKLVDFGIARRLAAGSRTATLLTGMGTPGYAPPEQYSGGQTDPRSDIYALGATLYHLLTGQAPPESVQVAAGLVPAPDPGRLREMPAALAQVLLTAMASRVEGRYPSATAMGEALATCLAAPVASSAAVTAKLNSDGPAQPNPSGAVGPHPTESTRYGKLLTVVGSRFAGMGWGARALPGFDLVLEAPGIFSGLLAITQVDRLDEESMDRPVREFSQLLEKDWVGRWKTSYLIVASTSLANPMAVEHRARELSRLRGYRKLAVVPLGLAARKLLTGFLPSGLREDNNVNGVILNLGACVGNL